MAKYRFKKAGHFMGKYFDKDVELELNDKQAKYALLSGQIEAVDPVAPKMRPKAAVGEPFFPKPAVPPKKVADKQGEYSQGRHVGGTTLGSMKRG